LNSPKPPPYWNSGFDFDHITLHYLIIIIIIIIIFIFFIILLL